jgi:hypothetical protein
MRLLLLAAAFGAVFLLGFLQAASAQSLTVKASINPLLSVEERIPLSAALGLEVGLTPRSALQLTGSYRHFRAQDQEPGSGPKLYFDYRYYFAAEQPLTGFFAGPFLGVGRLKLGLGDDPLPGTARSKRTEQETGLLLGYQRLLSRLTLEAFAGPAYRWETTRNANYATSQTDFLWLRVGFTVGVRIKK